MGLGRSSTNAITKEAISSWNASRAGAIFYNLCAAHRSVENNVTAGSSAGNKVNWGGKNHSDGGSRNKESSELHIEEWGGLGFLKLKSGLEG